MISCRYPVRAVVRDYLLAAVGLGLFLPPVALMDLPLVTDLVFIALAMLFLLFGVQSFRRHRIRIELRDDGLRLGPGGREFPWRALSKLVLSYFAVRRDGERGWMELKLVSGGERIRIDSRLDGFTEVATCAALAAKKNGLELDPATATNLAALGIEAADAAPSAAVDGR